MRQAEQYLSPPGGVSYMGMKEDNYVPVLLAFVQYGDFLIAVFCLYRIFVGILRIESWLWCSQFGSNDFREFVSLFQTRFREMLISNRSSFGINLRKALRQFEAIQ